MHQGRQHLGSQKFVTLQDVGADRFAEGVAEAEGKMFFEASEDGVVFDELFDFEVGEVSVEVAELFYGFPVLCSI